MTATGGKLATGYEKQSRDSKLDRETHGTFAEYVADRFGMSRPRAYQLIEFADVDQNLSTTVDKGMSERHSREIAKAPLEKQQEVVNKAHEMAKECGPRSRHL